MLRYSRVNIIHTKLLKDISSSNQDNNPPRTPARRNGGNRTCGTPNRTPNRQTPNRLSFQSKAAFKAPKAPDFVALAQEQRQTTTTTGGHNSFFAYNPEKEPIKVPSSLYRVLDLTNYC